MRGLFIARENRRLDQASEIGILVDQRAQRDEIAFDRLDGFLFLGQFENGVRIAPRQSGFLRLLRRHIRPSAACAFEVCACRLTI